MDFPSKSKLHFLQVDPNSLSRFRKFLHLDQCINLSDKSCAFVEAIETLQQIITVFLPVEKLSVIRSTVKKMTPVAQQLLGDAYVWNMDDLFPLFLYVVVRARIPHLGAELEFMEHFMDRNLENGELGIMFTTLKVSGFQAIFAFDWLMTVSGLLSANTARQISFYSLGIVIDFLPRGLSKVYLKIN